jgi:4-hydroxy-3-polyprenylbenzoate decarboxylase
VLGDPPPNVKAMTEAEILSDMETLIKASPRSWKEILQTYHGQPYPIIYRAFGTLRHRLGRLNDAPWYRYTFSGHDFAPDPVSADKVSNFDARHRNA